MHETKYDSFQEFLTNVEKLLLERLH